MKNKSMSQYSETQKLKIPPNSIEAEQAVLGGLMLDNQAWDKIADKITQTDFYRQEHRLLFQVMQELAERSQACDVLTLAEALKQRGKLDEGGGDVYLYELAKNTPSAANIVTYASIVRERSILRQMIAISNKIADSAFSPGGRTTNQLLDDAEREIFTIAEQNQRGSGVKNIKTLLVNVVEHIDALFHSKGEISGLATGYSAFDEMTSGLQQSDLIVVAGRPSMGKTTFAVNIAEHAAIKDKKPVLIFSMEMPGNALALRSLSSLGRIDQHKIRTGNLNDEDWPRISSAVSMLSEATLFIDDTPALTPQELRARARRLYREQKGLALIVVDYLQLMQMYGHKENRTTEISAISRNLKALARELNVPIIAVSQLNRSLEQRTDKRPVMSDLRESGAIEQDADLIVFIYRDEVYNDNSANKGKAEIIIAKHRNGPIGKFLLTFLGKYTRFENFVSDGYLSEDR